jgi:carbonic anhydrase
MNTLTKLIEKNKAWAKEITDSNPEFFTRLSQEQTPEYLWIGCSDSRVPANQIVSLPPGELFVHRNIANVVVHTDLNCLSVIQFAVEVLHVKHIIVCGHYGCGGILAAMEEKPHGLIDNWLRHIKDVARLHDKELKHLSEEERYDRLSELNVIEQVFNVCNTSTVINHWKHDKALTVHGLIYAMHDGILKDLNISVSSIAQLESFHHR